ncbi:MAG: CAP domain-containing protein [Clostridium cadaveris]|uniref:CAP domain-containing protein n=1 Tax=Clostridium cadaveris TaxID=1529 RepID=UPI002A87279F|nr:CAP domain-containing protein [Clostridium cadaveris]
MKKKILSLIISSILVIGGGTVSILNRTKNNIPSKISEVTKTVEEPSEDVVASSDSQIATQESNEQTKSNESASEVNTVNHNTASENSKAASSNSNSSKSNETAKASSNKGQASGGETSSRSNKNTSKSSSSANGMPAIPQNHNVEFLSQVENEILTLCNNERAKAGLKPLSMDETMRKAARYKAEEMLQYGYFDHNSPYTGSPFQLLQKFNISYNTAGENIQSSTGLGKASVTAQDIVNRWMNSAGHRANILNANFGRMGIGVAFSSEGNLAYESQLFAN